jgi:hypothetical protein
MLSGRKFNIVKVSTGDGTGMDAVKKFNKVVDYTGMKLIVKL